MTQDVSAGRLHLDVYADARGATKGLQARVDAEMARANIRAKIKTQIDTRGIVTEAKRAAAEASKAAQSNVRVKIKMGVDTRGLAGEIARAAKDASRNAVVQVRAEIDRGSIASAHAAAAAIGTGTRAEVNVDADTASADAQVEAFRQRAGRPVVVPVRADTSSLRSAGTALTQLSKIPALAGGFYLLGTAIVQVGGGLVAMASSATSAAATLAVIPNIAGTAMTAIATLLTGFSGVGEAVKQMQAVQSQAGQTATTAAAAETAAAERVTGAQRARAAAADRVKDAQRALADAVYNAGQQQKAAAEAVSDAQWALARSGERVQDAQRAVGEAHRNAAREARAAAEAVRDASWSYARSGEAVLRAQESLQEARYHTAEAAEAAQERITRAEENAARSSANSLRAQQGLNDAREAARERIDDMNEALRQGAMDEEGAVDALTRAREDLQDVQWNEAASPQERRDAEMAVREAERRLEQIRTANTDLAEDVAKANEEGVEGSAEVADAQQAIIDAERDQIAAVAELTDAREDAEQQALEVARNIRDAEYAVRDAIHAQGEAREELKAARQAEKRLTEENARAVLEAERGLRDAIHAQQEAREELANAQEAQRRGAVESARAIADAQDAVKAAQQGVRDASREVAAAQQAATDVANDQTAAQLALASAMDNLSPAGRRFAQFLSNVMLPRLHEFKLAVQEALLPGVQLGMERAMPLLDTLQTGMVQTATILGRFAANLGKLFGSAQFNLDIGSIMSTNNEALRNFLPALRNLLLIFVDLAVVAGPTLLVPFSEWVRTLTRGWKEAAQVNRESGAMAGFFERSAERAGMLKDILGNLFTALYNIGVAASPTGDSLLSTFEKTTQKWADWTKSDLGQDRMKKFFEATEPTTKAVGDLVAQLSEMVIKLGEAGGGPLTAFVKALTAMVNGVNFLLDIPFVGQIIGWGLTLAGVGGAVGLVGGMFLKMGGNIKRLTGLIPGLNGVLARLGGFLGGLAKGALGLIVRGLSSLGGLIVRVATGFIPMLLRALPLLGRAVTLMFGPWGIAIAAVVGLFILLYNKVDWFRTGVQWVMQKVVDAFNWVVDGAKHLWDILFGHSVFPDIQRGMELFKDAIALYLNFVIDVFKTVGKVAKWLWSEAIQPAWENIKDAIQKGWQNVLKPVLTNLWEAVETVGGWFRKVWKDWISPAWDSIKTAVENGWNNVLKPTLKNLWEAVETVGGWFRKAWRDWISPAWDSIKTAVSNGWENVIKPPLKAMWEMVEKVAGWFRTAWQDYINPAWDSIKTAIKDGWDNVIGDRLGKFKEFIKTTLPTAFKDGVAEVKGWWDDLKGHIKTPIKAVIDTVWNNGLRKMIGYLPGVTEPSAIETKDWASGTARVLPGYTPGRDVHHFTSPTGGRLNLSGGEAIMRPEFTDRLGEGTVNMLNAAARAGKGALDRALGALSGRAQGHAKGGVYSAVERGLNFWLGGVMPLSGASASSHGSSYPFPAYDLNYPGYADYGKPIVAWAPGVAQPFDLGSDRSYGRGQTISHGGGQTTLYAHMSKVITSLAGKAVRAGQTIGYVGDYGNTGTPPTSHLHFEIRGGSVDLGDASTTGPTPEQIAQQKGEEEKQGWLDRITGMKDILDKFPGWLKALRESGPWSGTMMTSVKRMGSNAIQWINDKIPDEIKIPKLPDIPLPNNPIPNVFELFDRGGEWRSGVLGLNMSGKSETVFTNSDMVDLGASLRGAAATLRALIKPEVSGDGGLSPLVGELTLMGRPEDMPNLLADANMELRKIRMGGLHAKRVAGAPA